MVTADSIIAAARASAGRDLPTIGGRTTFRVTVEGGVPVFYPISTGLPRAATNRNRLEQVAEIFNRTGSLKIPDYTSTGSRNLSYILRLVQLAR